MDSNQKLQVWQKEALACLSHIKHHKSLNSGQTHWVLSVTHAVTANKGNLSRVVRMAKKACIAFIISHLDVGGKLSLFLTNPCAPPFHQASKSENSQWQQKIDNENWPVTHSLQWDTWLIQKLVRKKERWGASLILQLPF